jgi:pyrroline-5-carboxylate reductase
MEPKRRTRGALAARASCHSNTKMAYELAILGAGNMAEAIARGVLAKKVFSSQQMIAADPVEVRREVFSSQLGIKSVSDNADAARDAKILLLSTKPYQMKDALAPVGAVMNDNTLVISIAAGITSRAIVDALGGGKKWRVIRTMPNTPMLVGEGVVGMAAGEHATSEDLATARRIFEVAADVIDVPEDKIDAVTALSGSGPAYFYFLVEHLVRAGVEMGLRPEDATRMAIKTAAGAGKLLVSSTDSPAELRRKVTTPGGTTHAAISHMEANGVGNIIVNAIKAAEARGRELGKS